MSSSLESNRLYRVNSETFCYPADEYQIGNYTDEMLRWIHENVQPYQFYTFTGKTAPVGSIIIAEILVYETM